MGKNKNKTEKYSKQNKRNRISLGFVKEALTLIGGLAGSILAIYGLVKTFKDDADGFSWLILVGIGIWLYLLWRLFQARKTTAYSLFIVSMLVGVTGWIGWRSQIRATEDKVIVLVAQFDGPEETYGIRRQIMEDLQDATKGYDDTVIIQSNEVVTSNEFARELGDKANADLVVWAWYRPTENPNITIHFENLSPAEIAVLQESETYQPRATLGDLESFEIQRQLGSETSTLVSFMTGMLRLKSGDYQIAVKRFMQVREKKDVSTYIKPFDLSFWIGYSYYFLGDYEQAFANYEMAIESDPMASISYNNRGVLYIKTNQYDLAIADFTKAIELEPMSDHFLNRGVAYGMKELYNFAALDFDMAISLDPTFFQAYHNRGNTYYHLGQFEKALGDYNKAIELNSNYPESYKNRADTYLSLKQYENAIHDYDRAIVMNPRFAGAYLWRGLVYQQLNKTAESESDFKKYEELTGEKP